VSVGGITTVGDAQARLAAGATLLQAYTAFVYEGPRWPTRIIRGLDALDPGDRGDRADQRNGVDR
jgi:dihydroorotate dehydrogenase